MSSNHESDIRAQTPGWDTATFVICSVLLVILAFVASFLGRFLSFAGTDTSRPHAALNELVAIAVYGPAVITTVAIIAGIALLVRRRPAWYVPLIGMAGLGVTYVAVAALV